MRATLKTLSNSDHATVGHLILDPEQEQFVDPLDLTLSELRNSSRPELEHPFAITAHDEVVGFFILREKAALPEWARPDAITLHSLRVGEGYQGKGYGKAANALAAEWILANRPCVSRLMLLVNARNLTARHVYLKSGYRDTGATYYGPIGIQNILEYRIDSG